jgi:amino acid adenylation domain-containing protein
MRTNLQAEGWQSVTEWTPSEKDYSKERCLHELIEEQVARTPEAVAVCFESRQITYSQLNERANKLARRLQSMGVRSDSLVGILMDRSIEIIVSILGIWKAGGAYLPIEPNLSKERVAYILKDAQVVACLTEEKYEALIVSFGIPSLTLKMLTAESIPIPCEKPARPTTRNLAYVIYTSGSTGQPKGVCIEHRNIVNYLLGIIARLDLGHGLKYATVSTFAADLGMTVVFPALVTGGALHIISHERATDGRALAEYFQRECIDVLKIVPSHLLALMAGCNPADIMPRKRLILGGESSRVDWIRSLHAVAPHCVIYNHYGPTETTVGVLTHRFVPEMEDTLSGTLPLGKPLSNSRVYVLDSNLRPVSIGVAGELFIGGAGVARGYINRADLTAAHFLEDPFSSGRGATLYKSGDRVRFLSDGNLEFLGRLDSQVKIHGFRVELGEIENALKRHHGVCGCAVMLREDIPGHKRLIAYTVASDDTTGPAELREFLQRSLPDYMVPTRIVMMEALPLNANGKLDRRALPKPEYDTNGGSGEFAAPSTQMEIALAALWCNAFGISQVGVHDNFFELGGSSLLAVKLIGKSNQELGLNLSIPLLFKNPTIRKIVELVERWSVDGGEGGKISKEDPASPFLIFQHKGTRPPVFFLHGDWIGGGLYCGHLSQQLGEEHPFYAIPPYRSEEETPMTIEKMASYHVASIQAYRPHGPYVLGGFCIGATVAMEMAAQFEERREKVSHLLLLNPPTENGEFLRRLWPVVDKIGKMFKWDLAKKFHYFEFYGVALVRWVGSSPRRKLVALYDRLTSNSEENTSAVGMDVGDREMLNEVCYKVYLLARRLYKFKPFTTPATFYLPEDGELSRFEWVYRACKSSVFVDIKKVRGDNDTCITKHAAALGLQIKATLEKSSN